MKYQVKTKFVLTAFLIVVCGPVFAQAPVHNWSFGLGGTYEEGLGAVAIGPAGSTTCLGKFYDTIDLGGGLQSGAGGRDLFLAKYGEDGSHAWSQTFGGLHNESAGDLLAMSDTSLVISGAFRDSIDFGGGMIFATGTTNGFLARFTADGDHLWSLNIGGSGSEYADRLVEDSAGNIILVGSFFTEVDLGDGPLISAGTSDVFVAKYASNGTLIWGSSFGSTMGEDQIYVDVDDNGDVVILGDFTTTINFGGSDLTSSGPGSFYLAKLSGLDGSHIWSKSIGGINGVSGNGLAVDGMNSIVCIGEYIGPVDFGGGVLTSSGFYTDLFLVKFDSDGSHSWSHGFGTTGVEPPMDVVVDSQDNILFIGYHYLGENLDFGGGPLMDSGGGDVFLATFSSGGAHVRSDIYGDASMQTGEQLAIGNDDTYVLAGTFMGAPDFGGGPLNNNGDFDIFMVSMDPSGDGSPVFDSVPAGPARLLQNVPNPFNPVTTIVFDLSAQTPVSLRVFDVSGHLIRIIMSAETAGPGRHYIQWDGRDDLGKPSAAGVYLYRLDTGEYTQTKHMTLVK